MSRNALGGSEICDDQLGNYGGSKSEAFSKIRQLSK